MQVSVCCTLMIFVPSRPKKPCNQPGCSELTTGRYCQKHHRQQYRSYDDQRGTAAQRGYGSRWRKARKRFLSLNPLCVHCKAEGVIVPATVVDHIVPHKGDKELFWDESNWQALCEHHHNAKTAKEDMGAWGNSSR